MTRKERYFKMFYVGSMLLVLGYCFTHNWGFYFQAWEVVSILVGTVILFCFLSHLNIKKISKYHNKKSLTYLSVPIIVLTIFGGVILSAFIKCGSNYLEGYGWILTLDQGWQVCSKDSVFAGIYGIFSMMLLLLFFIISIPAYSLCNDGRKEKEV